MPHFTLAIQAVRTKGKTQLLHYLESDLVANEVTDVELSLYHVEDVLGGLVMLGVCRGTTAVKNREFMH